MKRISVSKFEPKEYAIKLAKFLSKVDCELKDFKTFLSEDMFSKVSWCSAEAFEPITGGIFLQDYEWILCQSKYKKIFEKKQGRSFSYIMPLDNGVLLRGPNIYYYIACFRIKGKNFERKNVVEWKNLINVFFEEIISTTYEISDKGAYVFAENESESKLILGILDNLRHLMIHCATAMIVHENKKIDITDISENVQKKIMLLKSIHDFMRSIIFEKEMTDISKCLRKIITNVGKEVEETFETIANEEEEEKLGSCFKIHREADNFLENYLFMLHAASKYKRAFQNNKVNVCAVMSGGLELAILFAHHLGIETSDIKLASVTRAYIERQACKTVEVSTTKNFYDAICVLVDDNTLTGNTLKICYQIANSMNYLDVKSVLLRHPDINRIGQMLSYDCAVDIDFLEEECFGMLCATPYTRIPLGSNYGNEYLDSVGTFTLTGEFFLRYLLKNGLYSVGSEVGVFGTSLRCIVEDLEYEVLL